MKKSILLTLTLIISYASMSQNEKYTSRLNVTGNFISGITSDLGQPISKLLANGFVDNADKIQFYEQKHRQQVLRLNSKGDTLEITSSSVKYIKIDGKTYEIKRTSELVEIQKQTPFRILYADTSYLLKPKAVLYSKEELNFLNSAHSTDDYNYRLGILNLLKRNQK